jgi:hypothetical protein
MKRLSDFTVGFLLWALASACLLMGAAHDARGQVPIYTRPSSTASAISPRLCSERTAPTKTAPTYCLRTPRVSACTGGSGPTSLLPSGATRSRI